MEDIVHELTDVIALAQQHCKKAIKAQKVCFYVLEELNEYFINFLFIVEHSMHPTADRRLPVRYVECRERAHHQKPAYARIGRGLGRSREIIGITWRYGAAHRQEVDGQRGAQKRDLLAMAPYGL